MELPASFLNEGQTSVEQCTCGLAVDLGTTTLALYLCELGSRKIISSLSIKNPQVLYGDDVMSRIEATGKSLKQRTQLQRCVVHALEQGARQLLTHCEMDCQELSRIVVVGNPTMIHILLGENPKSIGLSPYQPAFYESRFHDFR